MLQPLSWLYGGLQSLRARAYAAGWLRSERAERPVVIVGNLTVGGTGKTPLTLWLAGELQARGVKVGLLSRGYKRRGDGARVVLPEADWREVGDEPLLLARRSGAATVVAPRPPQPVRACSPQPGSSSSSAMTACSTCAWRATARSWSSTARAASATGGCCPPDRCASRWGAWQARTSWW